MYFQGITEEVGGDEGDSQSDDCFKTFRKYHLSVYLISKLFSPIRLLCPKITTNIILYLTSKWILKGNPIMDTKWTLNWKRVRSGVFGEEFFSQKV